MAKLTKPQRRLLERLADVDEGLLYACGGHQAGTGFALVSRGLAEHCGYLDGGLRSAFTITDAGRAALKLEG